MSSAHSLPFNQLLRPASLFGAWSCREGVRFALPCRSATRVFLMLFERPTDATPWREYVLEPATHRHGDTWSILVPKARAGHYYAYRVEGPGHDPHQWILDPYARSIAGHATWGDTSSLHRGFPPKNGPAFPKGVIIEDNFNWGKDAPPRIPQRDLVVYELHVRGYTAGQGSGTSYPGTYRGLTEKIPYLRDLGVNAVELLPMFEFNELEYFLANDARASLRNFWGYSTLGFFAPMSRFAHASRPADQINEFKSMVKAFHAAGIEVILDVVYNHTSEGGGTGGPVTGFRALDPAVWYMIDEHGAYRNYSGCGNTVNANHPVVSDFIVESLRHWVTEFHIDGFRFDLATVFCRGADGGLMPPRRWWSASARIPCCAESKLIAEAWDAAGGYQVGRFPRACLVGVERPLPRRRARLLEGRLRHALPLRHPPHRQRRHVQPRRPRAPALGELRDLPRRLHPARSGQPRAEKQPGQPRGQPRRREPQPQLQLRRGGAHRRPRRATSCACASRRTCWPACCSPTVCPCSCAGDEFGRTQQGNNNAYCQDNEISYVDWSLLSANAELVAFVKDLIRLRAAEPVLRWPAFPKSAGPHDPNTALHWVGPAGGDPDWANGRAVACHLNGRAFDRLSQAANDLFMVFNAGDTAVDFHLPLPDKRSWKLRLQSWKGVLPVHPAPNVFRAPPRSTTVYTSARPDADAPISPGQ
jgi:isoamylase